MRIWSEDKVEICRDISSRKCRLILLLKTKDDPVFLRKWIDHHAALSREIRIVIADNGSTDPSVVETMAGLSADIVRFRFDGFHDFLHRPKHFPELFAAMAQAAAHFAILDTDEFLISVDGSRQISAGVDAALPHLKAGHAQALPWLPNVAGTDQAFVFGTATALSNLLRYGKPILPAFPPAPKEVEGSIIHNAHVPRNWYAANQIGGLFLLHLNRYSTEQRLRANHNKLVAFGFDLREKSEAEIAELSTRTYKNHTVGRLINEIKDMMKQPYLPWSPGELAADALMIGQDGQIRYGSEAGRLTFLNFIAEFQNQVGRYLGSEEERDPGLKGLEVSALQAAAEAAKAEGNLARVRQVLLNGLIDHPRYLDPQGHPYFRKELLRALLEEGRYDVAEGFHPIPGSPGGDRWHEILIARALDRDGKRGAATGYWRRVLQQAPDNREALDRLG